LVWYILSLLKNLFKDVLKCSFPIKWSGKCLLYCVLQECCPFELSAIPLILLKNNICFVLVFSFSHNHFLKILSLILFCFFFWGPYSLYWQRWRSLSWWFITNDLILLCGICVVLMIRLFDVCFSTHSSSSHGWVW
jgi:hypothetical protein